MKGRLGANVFHHYITKDVFTEVATPVNYAHGAN